MTCAWTSADGVDRRQPSVVFVHGGAHGSWCWHDWLPYFAARGWHALALNWYGRYGSRELPHAEAVQRGITDVTTEIGVVAASSARAPVVIAHSMGGLAALEYAATEPVAALVLLAPVVPTGFATAPTAVSVTAGRWWSPPELEVSHGLFWPDVDADMAVRNYDRLVPESPQAVWEAVTFRTLVDLESIDCPTFVIAAEEDSLVPAEAVRELGKCLGAETMTLPGQGHGIMLDPRWERTAETIDEWLSRSAGRGLSG